MIEISCVYPRLGGFLTHFAWQVIGAVAAVKESYHNCQVLFALLQLDKLPKVKMTGDLKADHLLLGMQSARARYFKDDNFN